MVALKNRWGALFRGKKTEFARVSADDIRQRVRLEVHRARRHNRPLTVVALNTRNNQSPAAEFAQQLAGNIRLLDFVILPPVNSAQPMFLVCPETGGQYVGSLARRLEKAYNQQIAAIGHATFPHDGEWFRELAEVATQRLGTNYQSSVFQDQVANDANGPGQPQSVVPAIAGGE